MSEDTSSVKRRRAEDDDSMPVNILKTPPRNPDSQETATSSEAAEPDVDIMGDVEDEAPVLPPVTSGELTLDESMKTPTKVRHMVPVVLEDEEEEHDASNAERVFSSFPCQVIPETLGRMTRTPPDGEHLDVFRNSNGRLRIFVVDHFKKFSTYSNLTHKPCTVCTRRMKSGEMHLNFPADLDRRRIWANLLGFKYKDILRSKMGPVSLSIAAGPICTEHFAEECFRNHNFNKAAIEAFGVPVAISPDVKTTPSKKSSRVPWVCTICDFHSCSVVELQTHLLDHTENMLKNKDSICDVPEAGFMCPFCRKCTYGYKTISGYRRHLNAGPIHHCHLRRIYEFAKMNCRATELDPVDSWDNWTRRNVYVAYHGCEPPANEIVLTPSPTKKAYIQNPEERTKLVHDEERRKKAVRSLSFVGKEGGTSVNDHNVMQRQVYLQIRRELEHSKKSDLGEEPLGTGLRKREDKGRIVNVEEVEEEEEEGQDDDVEEVTAGPLVPMGSAEKKKLSSSVTPSPIKKPAAKPSVSSSKKRKRSEPKEPTPQPEEEEEEEEEEIEEVSPNDPREKERRKLRDARFAEMVQKRSQQAKRLMDAKKFKKLEASPNKPRKALPCSLVKGTTTSSVEPEEQPEKSPEPSTSAKTTAPIAKSTRSTRSSCKVPPVVKPDRKSTKESKMEPKEIKKSPELEEAAPKEPEERPLKSMLARSFAAGVRPSMAQYQVPMDSFASSDSISTGAGTSRSVSSGAIARPSASSSPGGMFSQRVMGAVAQEKGPTKKPSVLGRRPHILSPRKRAGAARQGFPQHESSPSIGCPTPVLIPDDFLIPATDMEVEMVEEVIDSIEDPDDIPSSSGDHARQPTLTLAEALQLDTSAAGTVKDQDLEEISKKMHEEQVQYYRAMEDAIKGRTITKMRADMRLSRHCIRQIEAARARARLFGEGTEDYQIYYSNDGAQVLTKNDPKWRELQQQGPSDQQ